MLEEVNNKMIKEITELVNQTKINVIQEINKSIVYVYWNIGKIIVSNENEFNNRLEYGQEILKGLSKELTKYLGKGYSISNLKYMRVFYKAYPKYEELNIRLSWSHYLELMIIQDKDKRQFYEKECINENWSVRELRRQLDTSLFERHLLSDGKANKEKVLEIFKEGQIISKPSDIVKQPYVFEFLGIKEQKPILEKDLEYKLIKHIEDFLLELGKVDDNETPRFNDSARNMKIDNQDFTIYYSNECPCVEYEVKELSDYAKENNIKINFIKIDSLEKAKNAPCIFNNWANFYKEEFVSNTILNANSFEKLIKD